MLKLKQKQKKTGTIFKIIYVFHTSKNILEGVTIN